MKSDWIPPTTIIGSPATGNYFYPRKEIVDEIWKELNKGCNILIAAPRRVGKTSIMKHMDSEPMAGYKLIFENIQGLKSSEDFFKTIYRLVVDSLNKKGQAGYKIKDYLKKKRITEFDIKGSIKLENVELDFLDELDFLIPTLNKSDDILVLLLDELPEVLHNLHLSGKNEEASFILKTLRRWRQDDQYSKIKFILSGSIGIHYVVKKIDGRTSDLNDLKEVNYLPFEQVEAIDFIRWAAKDATVQYDEELTTYLISKIKYCVPYFLNLMLDQIDTTARKSMNKNIDTKSVDNAFESLLKKNKNFEDWKLRLKRYLPENDFKFINELLTHLAHNEFISIQEIYDKAIKYDKQSDYMSFIRDLEKDGYIVETDGKYVFISPFLKEFWKRDNPVYNG